MIFEMGISMISSAPLFTSSGMIAPASVPHVMTVESFHQSEPSPARSGISRNDTM